MKTTSVSIPWSADQAVTGRLIGGSLAPGVLLAHGAGTDQDHTSIVRLRDGIAAAGYPVLTFNYPYTERGGRRPDPQQRLLTCHRAVVEWFCDNVAQTVVGAGRSMGGRMATYLAAEGMPFAGLILFAYPLHPAGKPDRLRKDHLADVRCPMLFIVGTRDPMSTMALFDQWIRPLPQAAVVEIEDGDHSFRVRKSSGRTNDQAQAEIAAAAVDWLASLER